MQKGNLCYYVNEHIKRACECVLCSLKNAIGERVFVQLVSILRLSQRPVRFHDGIKYTSARVCCVCVRARARVYVVKVC